MFFFVIIVLIVRLVYHHQTHQFSPRPHFALLLTLASSSYGGVTKDTSGFSAFGYSAPVSTSRSASAGFSGFGFSTPAEVEASVSASAGVSGFGFSASATPSRSATVGGSAFGFSASAANLSPAFKEQVSKNTFFSSFLTALYGLAVIMEDKSERFLKRIEETDTLDRRARSVLRDLKNIVFDSFEILSEEEEGENWNEELENLLDAVQEMVDMFSDDGHIDVFKQTLALRYTAWIYELFNSLTEATENFVNYVERVCYDCY